jgi:four helix bundle protein
MNPKQNNKETQNSPFKEEAVSTPQINRSQLLKQLTDEIVFSIADLGDRLPNNESYFLRNKIKTCAQSAREAIDQAFVLDSRKMDRVRSMIKAGTSLEECREYLDLAQQLRYVDTNDIVDKIDKANKLIVSRTVPVNHSVA